MCDFGVSMALVYYSHVPVFVICLLLAFFIFHANRKSSVNRNIFIFIVFFCFWTVNDMLQWIITDPKTNLFLARISIVEAASLIFFLFAILSFARRKITMRMRAFFWTIFSPLVIFMFTDHNAYLVDGDQCNLQFGNLYWYLYVFMLAILGYTIYVLMRYYRHAGTDDAKKNQIKIIVGAFSFFVGWFILIMILTWIFVVTGNSLGDKIFLFTPFCMVVFSSMLAYAITKYQFLNIRSIAAQLLTYTIWILIATQYIFVQSMLNFMLVTFTFILSVIFGSMLIYAIRTETIQRKQLEVANAKLRKLDQAKSEFISMASHQLRTPLTTMKGFIGVMKSGVYGVLPKNFEEPLEIMDTANERLILLVEEMLNVSQIESGKMSFDFREMNINELIDELRDSFYLVAKNRGLMLSIKKSAQLPLVRMDYSKMRETLSNIIDNAIKYTQEGEIVIRTRREDGFVIVSVKDAGIGITQSEQKSLFEKFARGERAREMKKSGVGLGLYLGKKIIEAHRGSISAHTNYRGPGATFVVKIPISKK